MDTDIWRFLCGCPGGSKPQHLFTANEFMASADAGDANSLFSLYHEEKWYAYEAKPDWTAIAMAATKERDTDSWVVVAISQAGMTWELRPLERLESLYSFPVLGLTNLAAIGGVIFACGMGRVVFRRQSPGSWTELSARWPQPDEGVIGFTAIGGLSESLLYAVGWQGEIWTRADGQWSAAASPTNANLNALSVAPDGTVYVVGDGGALLKGQRGAWQMVDTGTDLNLMDVCVHEGVVYVCSDFDVYQLTDAGLLSEFSSQDADAPVTALKLFSAEGSGLFSVGPQDVFVRADGTWKRLA